MTPRSPSSSRSSPAMSAAARRITLNVPIRLTSMTRRNWSSGIAAPSRSTMRPGVPMPAQFTTMRAGPCWDRAAATAASVAAASLTSQRKAAPPIAAAASLAAASLASRMATFAPAAARVAAVARPRPEPPPLTSAACPATSMSGPAGQRHGVDQGHRLLAGVVAADAGIRHVLDREADARLVPQPVVDLQARAELDRRTELGAGAGTVIADREIRVEHPARADIDVEAEAAIDVGAAERCH